MYFGGGAITQPPPFKKKLIMPRKGVLTEENKEYIRKHYSYKSANEIADVLGVKSYIVACFASRYGLKKSKSQLSNMMREKTLSWRHGEKLEEFKAKTKGRKRSDEARRNISIAMRKMIDMERTRLALGLEQKTKLRIAIGGRKRQYLMDLRKRMKERGYILKGDKYYYHEQTNRTQQEKRLSIKYGVKYIDINDIDISERNNIVIPDWSDKQGGFAV